jgi:cephalosporin hydroxylase
MWEEGAWMTTTWLGRPVAQLPHDLVAMQELVWEQRPRVIVETGLAKGGSAVFLADLLTTSGGGAVISIDRVVADEVRSAIRAHPLGDKITIVEGDSVAPATVDTVRNLVGTETNVMVVLDSDHTRDHVRRELDAYSPLVPSGGWIVVFDGVLEWVAELGVRGRGGDKRWLTDSPLAAVRDFLQANPEFSTSDRNHHLGATFAPGGLLRRSVKG